MQAARCYRQSPSIVARKVAEEVILVPIRQNVADLQCIYNMNEVGARIWELLDGGHDPAAIANALATEYDVDRHQAETDVIDFLTQLESVGAVTSA